MKRVPLTTLFILAISSILLGYFAPRGGFAEEHSHGHSHGGHGDNEHGDEHAEEGKVRLSPEAVEESQITVAKAGPGKLKLLLALSGQVFPNADKVAHVTPRFPGIIKEVRKKLGDQVAKGDVLAVIESNESLQPYEVRSLIEGVVIERHATVGEFASNEERIFIVGDLNEVWADFIVPEREAAKVAPGKEVLIRVAKDEPPVSGAISFVSPVVDEATQSRFARVVIPNSHKHLSPGAFIRGEIVVDEALVAIAVTSEAIQSIEGQSVIFVREGEAFEKQAITEGRSDGIITEVLSGVTVGEEYVSSNSFLLKAELGKAEAEHEH